MSKLTKEHLITSLSTPEGYKNTKVYIAEIEKQNEAVYDVVSKALTEVLSTNKHHPLTKLHGLRLFKDIFQTAEFNCIQELDEKIENAIYRVAAYKKDSKDRNRGQTYFIEIDKKQESEEIKQLGLSYHLFALEIIKNFAQWFPKDFQDEPSRFKQYFQSLKKQNIAFPEKNSYFKADDQVKFKNNLKRWIQKEDQAQSDNQKKPEITASVTPAIVPPPPQSVIVPDLTKFPSGVPSKIPQLDKIPSRIPQPQSKLPQPHLKALEPQSSMIESKIDQSKLLNHEHQINKLKVEFQSKFQEQTEISNLNIKKLKEQYTAQAEGFKKKLQQKDKQTEKKLSELSAQIQQLKKKNKQLEIQKQQALKSKVESDHKANDKQQILKMTQEAKEKQKLIDTLQGKVKKLEELIKKKEATEQKLEETIQDITKNNKEGAGIQKLLEQEKTNADKLKKQLQEANTQVQEGNEIMEMLTNQNEKLKSKIKQLQNQLKKNQERVVGTQNPKQSVTTHQEPRKMLHTEQNVTEQKKVHSMPKTEKINTPSKQGPSPKKVIKAVEIDQINERFNRSTKLSELIGQQKTFYRTADFADQTLPTRMSIFGIRDIDGREVLMNQQLFQHLDKLPNIRQFKTVCLNQQGVFLQQKSLEFRLTKLGGTSQFSLQITNISKETIEVGCQIQQNDDYKVVKVNYKASDTLQPGKILQENFIVKPQSFQFTNTKCSISLKDFRGTIELPITVLSFCKFFKADSPLDKMFFSRRAIKSECFDLANIVPLQQYFGRFGQMKNGKFQALCTVTVTFNKDASVALKILSIKQKTVFQVSHDASSEVSEHLGDMLLQALLYNFAAPKRG